MTQRLYAFTLANRLKLASLNTGGGTTERLSTRMSADLVLLSATEHQLAFDPAQSVGTGITVLAGGDLKLDVGGHYDGDLGLYVDKSGGVGVELSVWLEKKPLSTGVWELESDSGSNVQFFDDGGQSLALTGHIEGVVGDEFRIMVKKHSGTATLTSVSKVVTLGTINTWAASLSVDRVGPESP